MKFNFCSKAVLILLLVLLVSIAKAQPVRRFNVITDAYYGFPNLMTGILRIIAEDYTDDPNLKSKGIGPFGSRSQFMLSKRVGVGMDFYYASSSFEYTNQTVDSAGSAISYHYKLTNTRPRFLARVDIHFGESKIFDPYCAFGLGYSAARYKFETDDPSVGIESYDVKSPFPVAYRMAAGAHLYFVKFMGVGAEFGLGGPLITFGLSGKF